MMGQGEPIAFAGGLLLGVVQNLVAGYNSILPKVIANLTGLRSAVPYLLVLVLRPRPARTLPP